MTPDWKEILPSKLEHMAEQPDTPEEKGKASLCQVWSLLSRMTVTTCTRMRGKGMVLSWQRFSAPGTQHPMATSVAVWAGQGPSPFVTSHLPLKQN